MPCFMTGLLIFALIVRMLEGTHISAALCLCWKTVKQFMKFVIPLPDRGCHESRPEGGWSALAWCIWGFCSSCSNRLHLSLDWCPWVLELIAVWRPYTCSKKLCICNKCKSSVKLSIWLRRAFTGTAAPLDMTRSNSQIWHKQVFADSEVTVAL